VPSVTKTIELEHSPEDAFALLTDAERFGEWMTIHAGWPNGLPALEPGVAFTQKLRIMGMPADVAWVVDELEAPHRMRIVGIGPMGARLATTLSIAPGTGGGAVVSYEAEFSGAGVEGPMGEMVTKQAGVEAEASLARLKALVA
jgi:hypothetical protein